MTNNKKASSSPAIEPDDATGVDAVAAQFRPAWENGETDTITALAPRPIERVTAQPKTDEDPTVKPVMMLGFEEKGERKITDLYADDEPTMRVAVHDEERTEVDHPMPTGPRPVTPGPPGPKVSPAAGAPQRPRGLAVLDGPSRTFDAQTLAQSDPEEMALSPMRPRAITVPTGFAAKRDGMMEEDRTQKDIGATRRPERRSDSELPETEEFVAPKHKRPIRIVFGLMGALVVLIGIGVIAKAAGGGGSAAPVFAAHATTEPVRADTPPAQSDTLAAPKPKADIPPPPPDHAAADLPQGANHASLQAPIVASLPAKPIVPARVPVAVAVAPHAKPPTAPAHPAAATPAHPAAAPQEPGKGGIVRDSPF